eukprot:g28258.t1
MHGINLMWHSSHSQRYSTSLLKSCVKAPRCGNCWELQLAFSLGESYRQGVNPVHRQFQRLREHRARIGKRLRERCDHSASLMDEPLESEAAIQTKKKSKPGTLRRALSWLRLSGRKKKKSK